MTEDIANLKSMVLWTRSKLLALEPTYKAIKEKYDEALAEWKDAVKNLEDHDFQEALKDGRTKKYAPGKRKEVKVENLTVSQILKIAEALGITIPMEEPNETDGTGTETDEACES